MALFLKQDFSPPILSRKWIAMKFRPNMLISSQHHIITILESGLLFREDSVTVEQEANAAGEMWLAAGGGGTGWLTRGEKGLAVVAICAAAAVFPPKALNRSVLLYLALYASVPVSIRVIHRRMCAGTLDRLVDCMREYLALARRATACLKECNVTRAKLDSVSSVIDSTHAMLCRQQSEMAILMSRASSALLGNVPWLRSDLAWDAITMEENENLMKIHHAFLVVQSTLLKHIAMAHFVPSPHARKMYKNHNERIYWIHHTLIQHLSEEFKQNYEALERMYRLLKNFGNADVNTPRKPGDAIKDTWIYSEVHNDIVRTNLELKVALNKCNNLDLFLDSCALHKQELDLEVLNKDIDRLIEHITKSLGTAQSSQIRLKKLLSKFTKQIPQLGNESEIIEVNNVLKIEDRDPETKDEVFYFVKTDDDSPAIQPTGDVTTGPGKKERETSKIVLKELRRKLVNREDLMRERERQALVKTMPELKDIPEFPRQIKIEDFSDRKGYIIKLRNSQKKPKKKLFRKYKIQSKSRSKRSKFNCRIKTELCDKQTDIKPCIDEEKSKFNFKSKLLALTKSKTNVCSIELQLSDLSDGLSDVESAAINKNIHQVINNNICLQDGGRNQNGDARNFRFSKKDLELSFSSDDSDMDSDRQMELLKDARKHRPIRKKNHPIKKGSIISSASSGPQADPDESLRPAQYSLGAGLAMASVLQVQSSRFPTMAQEEVFIGDGEVSADSGNDEDA